MCILVRVLHVVGAMDRAGTETFIMNLYRHMDRTKVQFDFLVNAQQPCDYDQEIISMGGKIHRIPTYSLINYLSYRRTFRTFLAEHPEYQIVHGHIGSSAPIYLAEAKRQGRYAIAHSHSAVRITSPSDIAFKTAARPVRGIADFYMACSPEAALDRFGPRIAASASCRIVNNGIDTEAYERNPESIARAKASFGFGDEPVFGHVGRFSPEKNHRFLLDVFASIKRSLPPAKLLLIGRGPEEASVHEQAQALGLSDAVPFAGIRDDIPEALRSMDVFLFPSIYEGLGISFVEAQTAGLPCIASTGIPDHACISDRAQRLSLDRDLWATAATAAYEASRQSKDDRCSLAREQGFDINTVAEMLFEFYREHSA